MLLSTGLYRRLAWASVVAATALIILGGIVRITGSGMGCGDNWPTCDGRLIPRMDFATAIEYGHRLAAAAVTILIVALATRAWSRHRHEAHLRNPALLALLLVIIQVLLGAVTVWLQLPPTSVILHLGTAMALVAVLVVAAMRAGEDQNDSGRGADAYVVWTTSAAAMGFAVILLGALVANLEASRVCQGFPLCNGKLLPVNDPLIHIHWTHRMLAYAFVAFSITLVVLAKRMRATDAGTQRAAITVLVLVGLQVTVAAAMVLRHLPSALRTLHLAVGTLIWVALVYLVVRVRRGSEAAQAAKQKAHPTAVRNATTQEEFDLEYTNRSS